MIQISIAFMILSLASTSCYTQRRVMRVLRFIILHLVFGAQFVHCNTDDMANQTDHSSRDMRALMSLTDITCAVDAARITSRD